MQDIALLLLRLGLGTVFIAHGLPKIKNPTGMSGMVGKPMSVLIAIIEFFGGLMLLTGAYTEIAASAVGLVMIGAIYFHIFKWHDKFVNIGKSSWEHPFTLLLVAIAVMILGAGAYSIDATLGLTNPLMGIF